MLFGLTTSADAQGPARKEVFQQGEELVYRVKYGFLKLGTVVIQTSSANDQRVQARLRFWTADVPLLHTRSTVTDEIDARSLNLMRFQEHSENGDVVTNKEMTYDPAKRTLNYSDDQVKNRITTDIRPFNDALCLLFNMRAWSGAGGKAYTFPLRGKDGEKRVTVTFTNEFSNETVPALEDKEVRTRVLQGRAEMGASSPLGADGAFTAYVSDDAAAVPVRIDMSIAVGSISLVLDHIKRTNWIAASR